MSLSDLFRSNRDRAKRSEAKYQSQLNDLRVKIGKANSDLFKAKTPSKERSLQNKLKRLEARTNRAANNHQAAVSKVLMYDKKILRMENRKLSDISARLTDVERQLLERVRTELSEEFVERQYDMFLCHDDRDQETATEFDRQLTEMGLDVWFDDRVAKRGLSLANQIDEGLANSHIGVILLTPRFFDGGYWRQAERGALLTSRKRVFPVRHDMTYEQLLAKSPLLADRIGDSTSADRGFEIIAQEIAEIVEEVKAEKMAAVEQDDEPLDEE